MRECCENWMIFNKRSNLGTNPFKDVYVWVRTRPCMRVMEMYAYWKFEMRIKLIHIHIILILPLQNIYSKYFVFCMYPFLTPFVSVNMLNQIQKIRFQNEEFDSLCHPLFIFRCLCVYSISKYWTLLSKYILTI